MAAKRLDKRDRDSLKKAVTDVLGRLLLHTEFPWPLDDLKELFYSGIDSEVLAAARLLKKRHPLALRTDYGAVFKVTLRSEEEPWFTLKSSWSAPFHIPSMITAEHPQYPALMAWCVEQLNCQAQVNALDAFFANAVKECSTTGQLVRVLPFITEYLPVNVAKTLVNMERQSRLSPVLNGIGRRDVEDFHSALALASLLRTEEEWRKAVPGFYYRPRIDARRAYYPKRSPWLTPEEGE